MRRSFEFPKHRGDDYDEVITEAEKVRGMQMAIMNRFGDQGCAFTDELPYLEGDYLKGIFQIEAKKWQNDYQDARARPK